jgi:LPS-assembly lipoprotein|tara:strand:- start:1947 stop:2435 length:489 start_codon:yes stop_codon:yes gene_type:complete
MMLKKLVIAVLCTMVAACGFQLRGAADLPESIQTMHIQGISMREGLGLELKRTLRRNGINVIDDYSEGAAVLSFLKNRYERRVLSVGGNAKVSEYELILEVTFQLTDKQQNKLIDNESLEARRDYQFDQEQVLGRDGEERLLREEMDKQVSQAILRRLAALD